MEPTIYKPSIYKGTGIYKIGAEGASGQFGSFPFKTDLTNYANGVDQPQIGNKYFIRNYDQYNITDDTIVYDGISYNGKKAILTDTSLNPIYSLCISGCEKIDLTCKFLLKISVGTRSGTIGIIWLANGVGICADRSSQSLQFIVNSSYPKNVYNSTFRRSDGLDWYYIDNADISGFKIKFELDISTNKITLYVNDLKRLETDFVDEYFYGIKLSPRFDTSISIANIEWH
jgi:hypothetical protein